MACCKCCCGGEDCASGQVGKCCCGGSGGVCCQPGEYCCSGVCEPSPCPPPPECESDEDCPEGECCNDGVCGECAPPPCESDEDCPEGEYCCDGVCQELPCEGACCTDDGNGGSTCTDGVLEGDCTGVWLGAGTTCLTDDCPTGSCCDPATGDCTVTPPWGCAPEYYTEGGVCDPNPCPQLGACCYAGECSQTLEADCLGVWIEGVECDPDPCPPLGACCSGHGQGDPEKGYCSQTYEVLCLPGESEFGDGIRWTEGVSCDPNPCGDLGWCCLYVLGLPFGPVRVTEAWCDDFDATEQPPDGGVWYSGEEPECPPP